MTRLSNGQADSQIYRSELCVQVVCFVIVLLTIPSVVRLVPDIHEAAGRLDDRTQYYPSYASLNRAVGVAPDAILPGQARGWSDLLRACTEDGCSPRNGLIQRALYGGGLNNAWLVDQFTDFRALPISGSCEAAGGDGFCRRVVPNSFCAMRRDECFCLPGHVSVQEENGRIVCKPCESTLFLSLLSSPNVPSSNGTDDAESEAGLSNCLMGRRN
ncbi:unnamed protein product [Protopolystoma xenopodis]|uniref:Uncharacterized protein n=1 Tax=Protopolystoma xenopodis TaxID=117903 RepID=A0A3S4ZV90_9PLAT|nr:unnamed protein product [Protopolystoma xenopodis]